MRRRIVAILSFCLFWPCLPFLSGAYGQDKQRLALSLGEASRMALDNSLDVRIARYDAYIRGKDIYRDISVFDTLLEAELGYKDDRLGQNSVFAGTRAVDKEYDISLTKKTPTGTTLGLGFEHLRQWTNSGYVDANPAYDLQGRVSLKQELGRNFFGRADRAKIKMTRLGIENAAYTSWDKIEGFLAAAQKAYWRVAREREKLRINEKMLGYARSLYHTNLSRYDRGLIEEPELLSSQVNLDIRSSELLLAQERLAAAENGLLLRLNQPEREQMSLEVTEGLALPQQGKVEASRCLALALDSRRDYKAAKNSLLSGDVKLVIKKDSLFPQIDLSASFAKNGLSDKYSRSLSQITSQDQPEYYLGLKVVFPLENTAARGEYAQAELERARSILRLKNIERRIIVEVSDKARAVNTAYLRAESARNVAALEEKKLNAERKRFRLGRSDSDTIIRYQQDLLQARLAAVDVLYEYYARHIELKDAEDSLLSDY